MVLKLPSCYLGRCFSTLSLKVHFRVKRISAKLRRTKGTDGQLWQWKRETHHLLKHMPQNYPFEVWRDQGLCLRLWNHKSITLDNMVLVLRFSHWYLNQFGSELIWSNPRHTGIMLSLLPGQTHLEWLWISTELHERFWTLKKETPGAKILVFQQKKTEDNRDGMQKREMEP